LNGQTGGQRAFGNVDEKIAKGFHSEHVYLLWRNIQSDCPQVHLLIVFNAGQDEKKTYVESEEEGARDFLCAHTIRSLSLVGMAPFQSQQRHGKSRRERSKRRSKIARVTRTRSEKKEERRGNFFFRSCLLFALKKHCHDDYDGDGSRRQ